MRKSSLSTALVFGEPEMGVEILRTDGRTAVALVTLHPPVVPSQEVYEVTYQSRSHEIDMIFQRVPLRTADFSTFAPILVLPREKRFQKLRFMMQQVLRGVDLSLPAKYPRAMPIGDFVIAWARPRNGNWGNFDGKMYAEGEERSGYRPVMISGMYEGQRVFLMGSRLGYPLDQFEIGPDVTGAPIIAEPQQKKEDDLA
jgi:hypothetical protein